MASFQAKTFIEADLHTLLLVAQHHLAARGFKIINLSQNQLHVEGPGLNSTRQDPLLGATRIDLHGSGQSLELMAELGGISRMRKFVLWFPFCLCAFLTALFIVIYGGIFQWPVGGWWLGLIPMLPAVPWLFISPWLARVILKRTEASLSTFLNNLAHLAKNGPRESSVSAS